MKLFLRLSVFLFFLVAGRTTLFAQFNDPINTAVNATHSITASIDAMDQFFTMLDQFELSTEQLEKMKEWKEKMDSWREDIESAKGFIDQVTEYAALAKMLEQQVQMLVFYGNMIKSLGTGPYSSYYIASLFNYATNMGYTVQGIIDSIKTIIMETGIDKAQRQDMITQKTEEGKRMLMNMEAKLIDEITFLSDVRELVDFGNKFIGRNPGDGLDRIGAESSGSHVPIVSSSSSASSKPSASIPVSERLASGVGGTLYKIILIIIGISCLGSLIFAFARYVQGQHGAETMFIRIFAVIVIVFIAFSALSTIFKY